MSTGGGRTPGHPLIGRQRRLLVALRGGVAALALLAVGGLLLPGDARTWSATAVLVALIGTPTVRVAWLGARWLRRGDLRFAAVAVAVLAVLATAAVVALSGG